MAKHQMSMAAAVLLLLLAATVNVQGRTVSNRIAGLEKALTDASATPASSGAPLAPQPLGRSLAKRSLFDPSCRGTYDREMYRQLDRVCDDCYNLYRKPYVEIECRRDCFANAVFEQCLYDLMLQDAAEEYKRFIHTVGK